MMGRSLYIKGPGRGNWTINHGGARRSGRAPEYNVWAKMRRRCEDPKSPDYPRYGGRGIRVCDRWSDFGVFLQDMGTRPTEHHTLERVDNDAGYSPSNCIWATRKHQAQNRRPRKQKTHCKRGHALSGDNVYLRPDGKRGCRSCRRLNMRDFYRKRSEVAE